MDGKGAGEGRVSVYLYINTVAKSKLRILNQHDVKKKAAQFF